jgi:hypothetical protein
MPGDAGPDDGRVDVGRIAQTCIELADERDRLEPLAVAEKDAAVVVIDQQP